jgi:hypothetical protein
MDKEQRLLLFRKAVKAWGKVPQLEMAIEEMAELTVELMHYKRCRVSNIAEEIADVELCLEQLKDILHLNENVEEYKDKKLVRLQVRLLNSDTKEGVK